MHSPKSARAPKRSPTSLDILVRWGASVLGVWQLAPPRTFTFGGPLADVSFPSYAAFAATIPLVVVDDGGVVRLILTPSMDGVVAFGSRPPRAVAEVAAEGDATAHDAADGARAIDFPPGSTATLTGEGFTIEVSHGDFVDSPVSRWHVGRRMLPFHAGSAAVHLGAVLVFALMAAPATDSDELASERTRTMQYYLRSANEAEPEEPAPLGTRAKGEEGGSGSARYGVPGPRNGPDPHFAGAAAMRDAAEFGMIGLLSAAARDERATPPAPPSSPRGGGSPHAPPRDDGTMDGEEYGDYGVNPPTDAALDRLSTFAVDVDTGSYSIARRKIVGGTMPPKSAVRPEEFINAFDYGYAGPAPADKRPFRVHLAAAPSPFSARHHLLRVGIQGRRISAADRAPVHLVYLVDTSGSMQSDDKIGLAKQSLKLLTTALRPHDTVALCTYAGSVREVLPPTPIAERARIIAAIDELTAEGSTAMASGIELAYRLAERTLVKGDVNRVVILSDGDANVGPSSRDELLSIIARYKDKGITLSTVGFGEGNYKDSTMEQLADKGDGNYSYIDGEREARRVFSKHVSGTLQVIARDVKIQVEFDPGVVGEYRLIGYENRDVADAQFRNDKVDGGEIGSGHSVTALYDLVLRSTTSSPLTVRIRYKDPLASESASESAFPMDPVAIAPSFSRAPDDLRFATAVAAFADVLRRAKVATSWRLEDIAGIAESAAGDDEDRREFAGLVRQAARMTAEAGVRPAMGSVARR
jgi:Ca-activated chloride channel family protein